MKETHLILRTDLPGWAVVLVAVACAAVAVLAYRRTARPVSFPMQVVLVALRLLAFAVLLVCLARPARETTTYTVRTRPLVLLVDESRSMSEIRDMPHGRSRLETAEKLLMDNAEELEALREQYEITRLGFARAILPKGRREPAAINYSAYGRAIQDGLKAAPLGQCDAVVLIGDGSHNLGPPDPLDMAMMLAERNVPLFSVGVGREQAGRKLRDAQLLALDAPRAAPVASTFQVRGRVLLRGLRGEMVKVRMEFPGQPADIRSFPVGHDEEVLPVLFEVTPEKPGVFRLTMRVLEVADEILLDNNARAVYVKVTTDALRVGIFDSLRPESKFAYQSLRGAKQVVVKRILLTGADSLNRSDTDWELYDVVVLGDVSPQWFRANDLAELRKAVEEGGKGLVLAAGPRSAGAQGFSGTAIEKVLPLGLSPRWQYAPGDVAFQVDARAAGHPIVALASQAGQTLSRWRNVPQLAGYVRSEAVKPGALILARAPDGAPLLAVQQAGAGRAVCLMTDTTFRWFFTDAPSQEQHKRLWRQMVQWAGSWEDKRDERLRLKLSKTRLGIGEPLSIEAHFSTYDDQPVRDARVELELEGPDGSPTALETLFSRDQEAFMARYTPRKAGEYKLRARALRGQDVLDTDMASFQAVSTDRELQDPVADLSLLRRLSAETSDAGGKYYPRGRFARLLRELAERGDLVRLSTKQWREVWDRPWLFALLLCTLTAEWALRKWKGLL